MADLQPVGRKKGEKNKQGPVVQSIVSLTTSLRRQHVKFVWTTLSKMLLFFVEKYENLLSAKDSHIFLTKNNSVFVIFAVKSLTKCLLTASLISNNWPQNLTCLTCAPSKAQTDCYEMIKPMRALDTCTSRLGYGKLHRNYTHLP